MQTYQILFDDAKHFLEYLTQCILSTLSQVKKAKEMEEKAKRMATEAEKKAKDAAALQKEVGTVLQGVTTVVYN